MFGNTSALEAINVSSEDQQDVSRLQGVSAHGKRMKVSVNRCDWASLDART